MKSDTNHFFTAKAPRKTSFQTKNKAPVFHLRSWRLGVLMKNKDTVLFLGLWERINNSGFNSLEFEGIKNEAGRNSFFLSAKNWIERMSAKGLIASAGR